MDPLSHYIFFGNRECKFPSVKYEKICEAVVDSKLFDEGYYLEEYPDIKKFRLDPLLHYILFGYKEGKLPSIKFDGNYYLNLYKDVKKSNFNPLIHYILYGKAQGKIFKSSVEDYKFEEYSHENIDNILSLLNSDIINIILYVHNDFEETKKCINSIQ